MRTTRRRILSPSHIRVSRPNPLPYPIRCIIFGFVSTEDSRVARNRCQEPPHRLLGFLACRLTQYVSAPAFIPLWYMLIMGTSFSSATPSNFLVLTLKTSAIHTCFTYSIGSLFHCTYQRISTPNMADTQSTAPSLDPPLDKSIVEHGQPLRTEAGWTAFTFVPLHWLHQQLYTFLHEVFNWFHDHIYPGYTFPTPEGSMACMIHCEIMDEGRVRQSSAKALIDTGNPLNLMSRTLAHNLGVTFSAMKGDPVLVTPGNNIIRSVGQIRLRWTTNNVPSNSRFSFHPKYYDDVFEVLEEHDESFDMIIGSETILKRRFAKWNLPLGAAGRRYNPRKLDSRFHPTSFFIGNDTNASRRD